MKCQHVSCGGVCKRFGSVRATERGGPVQWPVGPGARDGIRLVRPPLPPKQPHQDPESPEYDGGAFIPTGKYYSPKRYDSHLEETRSTSPRPYHHKALPGGSRRPYAYLGEGCADSLKSSRMTTLRDGTLSPTRVPQRDAREKAGAGYSGGEQCYHISCHGAPCRRFPSPEVPVQHPFHGNYDVYCDGFQDPTGERLETELHSADPYARNQQSRTQQWEIFNGSGKRTGYKAGTEHRSRRRDQTMDWNSSLRGAFEERGERTMRT